MHQLAETYCKAILV